MTRLLIVTNSLDGSADYIARELTAQAETFFRWNVDLWDQYRVIVSDNEFMISDPMGRSIDLQDPDVHLLWRKPFTDLMRFEHLELNEHDIRIARSSTDRWLQALAAMTTRRGRTRLVEPFADRRLPKMTQLQEAKDFFSIPSWSFSNQSLILSFGPQVVTKPLGDPNAGDGRIFYSRCVNYEDLYRPFPWFVQNAIVGDSDVTCVHILGRNYFYECDFQRSHDAIDWRVEINRDDQSDWHPLQQDNLEQFDRSVTAFMCRIGLHFGRLDFIKVGNDLVFLECNSNGQFGWLDDLSSMGLHKAFLSAAMNPRSQVQDVFLNEIKSFSSRT